MEEFADMKVSLHWTVKTFLDRLGQVERESKLALIEVRDKDLMSLIPPGNYLVWRLNNLVLDFIPQNCTIDLMLSMERESLCAVKQINGIPEQSIEGGSEMTLGALINHLKTMAEPL